MDRIRHDFFSCLCKRFIKLGISALEQIEESTHQCNFLFMGWINAYYVYTSCIHKL